MNKIDISVVLVNYFTCDLVKNAISSFKEHAKDFTYEIIVVDNSCSIEEKDKLIKEIDKDVRLIFLDKNVGFGNANNEAVKVALGEYIYFLNDDTITFSNSCFELLSFLKNNPEYCIAGSNIVNVNKEPAFSFQLYEKNYLNDKKYSTFKKNKKNYIYNNSNKPIDIEGFVSGASFMMKKVDYNAIGGFPKEIFLYAEDAFLCYKARSVLKKKIANVPSSTIIHLDGKSFGNTVTSKRAFFAADGNYWYYKLLFGDKTAIKYLRLFKARYKRYSIICFLMFKKNTAEKFKSLYLGYKKRLSELK